MFFANMARRVYVAALASTILVIAVSTAPALAGRPNPPIQAKGCTQAPTVRRVRGSQAPTPIPLVGDPLARCQGGFGYSDRPADVRAVLTRMYGNDHRYRTFSALFTDRLPGDSFGSVRLYVRQPGSSVAALYSNSSGRGTPVEVRHAYGETMDRYAPAAGVFTTDTRVLQPLPLPPLDNLPPTIQQGDFTNVSFADATGSHGAL